MPQKYRLLMAQMAAEAKAAKQRCNRGATEVQQRRNRGATEVQQRCNRGATEAQQRCNRDATEVQQLVRQGCNRSSTAVMLAKAPCVLNCGGGGGGGGGGVGEGGRCRENTMLRLLGWRRWRGRWACGSRRRGWRLVAAGRETGRSPSPVARPSRRPRRRNRAHELPLRPRPAAAPLLAPAAGRHGPPGPGGGAHGRRSPAQRPGPQRPATRPQALLLEGGTAAAAAAAGGVGGVGWGRAGRAGAGRLPGGSEGG